MGKESKKVTAPSCRATYTKKFVSQTHGLEELQMLQMLQGSQASKVKLLLLDTLGNGAAVTCAHFLINM